MRGFDTIKQLKNEIAMEKEWYILIDDQKEGPYHLYDLKIDKRLTPDTLVWKEGWKEWVALRFVSELKEVFQDEEANSPAQEKINLMPSSADLMQEEALTIQQDPSQFFLWILVFILVMLYLFYQSYR